MQPMYRRQLFFSISLVVLIPLVLFANFLWYTYSNHQVLDEALRASSVATTETLASSLANQDLSQPELIKGTLNDVVNKNAGVVAITVYREVDGNLTAAASTDHATELELLTDAQTASAWRDGTTTPELQLNAAHQYVWQASAVIRDTDGKKHGLVTTQFATDTADQSFTTAYYQSFTLLLISEIGILLLLISSFVSIGYARKNASLPMTRMKEGLLSEAITSLQSNLAMINKNYAELAKRDYDKLLDTPGEQYVEGLHHYAADLTSLSSSLLTLNQLAKGEIQPAGDSIELSAVVTQSLERLKKDSRGWGISIHHNESGGAITIKSDRKIVTQVMQSLLQLVAEHTNKGEIVIDYQSIAPGQWSVIIKGTPFQTDTEQSDALDFGLTLGTGFWISAQLMQRLGGQLQANLKPVHVGTFVLSFPGSTAPSGADKIVKSIDITKPNK